MKAVRILYRNINNAFKSIFRNFSLSVASIVCTTITLILVSIAVIVAANINNFLDNLENEITIIVFLDDKTTQEQEESVKNQILTLDNISKDGVLLKNREEVKKELMNENDSYKNIMSTWTAETNPLKSEVIVTVEDVHSIRKTAEELEKLEYVDYLEYGDEMVKNLVTIFDGVKIASVAIIASLIIVTIFLICNTIKLTIFSRKNEIDIMRLVGTSNTVIKLPFVIEGLFLGIIGAIIPIVLSIYAYFIIYDKLNGFFILNIIKMVKPMPFIVYNSILLLVIGAIVGMIGSYRSVRKYLKI